jgi:hypothetical protein
MNKLIRLENGSWIDPLTVVRIEIHAPIEVKGVVSIMDRFSVITSDGHATYVDCGSDTDAVMEADKLAEIVNEARVSA